MIVNEISLVIQNIILDTTWHRNVFKTEDLFKKFPIKR